MYCTRCGKEIPDGEKKICDDCQRKILEEIKNEELQVADNDNAEKVEDKMENKTKEKSDNRAKGKKEKIKDKKEKSNDKTKDKKENGKNKCLNIIDKIIVTVCIIFIILSIALACYSYITREIPGNTIGNIRNNGYATEQGNWIYYIAPVENSTEYGIYKIKKNGKDKQKIYSTDEDIISLNVYKDNLYFIGITNIEDDNLDNKIYQMKLDGSDLKVINDNEFHDNCYEIYAVYDKIFYVGTNGNICIMNLDGSEKETFLDNRTGYLGVTEKYIIFDTLENPDDTDYVTYIMNIDGTNVRPIIEGKRLRYVNVNKDYIYYTDEEKNLYRTKIDSNTEELVLKTKAYELNVRGKYAYYVSYEKEDNENAIAYIYRVKLTGKVHEPEKIKRFESYTSFLDVLNDYLMYMDSNYSSARMNLMSLDKNDKEIQLTYINYTDYYNLINPEGDSNIIEENNQTSDEQLENVTE